MSAVLMCRADLSIAQLPLGRTYRGPERHLFPTPKMPRLLGHVIKDSGCFQAFLASMATLMVLAKRKGNELALSQQGRAIKFVISACQDPASAATDLNIMTATFLANNDVGCGNIDAAERNFCGINYLINIRGGLHNLGMGGILAFVVCGVDDYLAVFKNRLPTYNMSLPTLALDCPSYKPKLGQAFRHFLSKTDSRLDPQLLRAGVDFSQLMDIYEKGAHNVATAAELTYFDYLQVVVEHQLTRANARFHGTVTENECVCLALLLCNLVVCRNYGSVIPIHHMLSSRLWRSLHLYNASMHTPCDEERANLGIWLVMVSISTALDGECPHTSDAVALLRIAKSQPPVRGWKELKEKVLDYYVWSEVAQGKLFREIWKEVEDSDEPERTKDMTLNRSIRVNEFLTPNYDTLIQHTPGREDSSGQALDEDRRCAIRDRQTDQVLP